jgi:4-hydroxy-2-oxoheptanedioate aldolase
MRIRSNTMKAKLKENRIVLGGRLSSYCPEMVELFGALDYDYVTVDCEHLPMDEREVENLIRAGDAFDIPVIIRMVFSEDQILRYLDAGAAGVHIPRINTAADARAVVQACRFYPEGTRTIYEKGRGAWFGLEVLGSEYTEKANREVFVLCQLEEVEAVRNLSEILAVPGIDCIQIGPRDLWQSMGMPDQSEVDRTMDAMIEEIVKSGIDVSLSVVFDREAIKRRYELGVKKFDLGLSDLVARAGAEFLQEIKHLEGG